MKKKQSNLYVLFGLLLIAAALFWTAHNIWLDHQAAVRSAQVLSQLRTAIPAVPLQPIPAIDPSQPQETAEIPDHILNPQMEMPVRTVDGMDYIGVLTIPTLGLELPICAAWSYDALNVAPCRFTGSAYTDDLVLAGHNYTAHFAALKALSPGDPVLFTDVDGNQFRYRVALTEILAPDAVAEMTQSGHPLTLFSCTVGGEYRVTVRCDHLPDDSLHPLN